MTDHIAIALPMLVQMGLTFVLMWVSGIGRYKSVVSGETDIHSVRLSSDGWPDRLRKIGNSVDNQFQTPTLFYALCLLAILFQADGMVIVILAWAYVGFRIAHAFVHTGANRLPARFRFFAGGLLCLMAMWAGTVIAIVESL